MYLEPKPPTAAFAKRTHVFKTSDGAELVGDLYTPGRTKPFSVVLLCGATAIPQEFYTHFAQWLASERGLACFTFDYRDIGRSKQGPLRASKTTMADWGTKDIEAARRLVRCVLPGTPIWHIGHSLGGMTLPFQSNLTDVARVTTVATGAVNTKDHPRQMFWKVALFWHVMGPALTAVFGYLPSWVFGLGENLPRRAFWQWRRWCNAPEFYMPDAGREMPAFKTDHLTMPIRFIAFSDDPTCPPASAERLADLYGTGQVEVIDPSPEGDALGHMGIFSRKNQKYWERLIA
ncbi:MAG: alpha/beta fold hydrolase [Rhodobacteraceae bacterium]|nr:alpha/beta fold hydrolase [Paracoccaceae bacterium]